MESRLEIAEQARSLGVPGAPFPGGPPPAYPGQSPGMGGMPGHQRPWMEVEPEPYQPPMYIYPNGTYAAAPQVAPTATHVIGKRHALLPTGVHSVVKRQAPPPLYMFIRPFPTSNLKQTPAKGRHKRATGPTMFSKVQRPSLSDKFVS